MAEKSFPYNSMNGDRKYKSEDFREYYAQLIGNGVIYSNSNALKVSEGGGMQITVNAGGAFIDGVGYINTATLNLTLDTADGALARIDRVVIRNDYTNRRTCAAVKKGSYSAQPIAAGLTRDADTYEIAIADIYIGKGVVNITQADITDTRLNNTLCGIVTGLIEQADTTEIFNQLTAYFDEFKQTYTAEAENWTETEKLNFTEWEKAQKSSFIEWVETIKDILDEAAAGHLQNEIEGVQIQTAEDAFKRYYGLIAQETEIKPDGTIVVTNQEATATTSFSTDKDGNRIITERIQPQKEGSDVYVKTTTIKAATATENKKISEVYSIE